MVSKQNSLGWFYFYQLLKVNSWTYCFCTDPNRLVGGTQRGPDEGDLAIMSLRGGSVKLQRNGWARRGGNILCCVVCLLLVGWEDPS